MVRADGEFHRFAGHPGQVTPGFHGRYRYGYRTELAPWARALLFSSAPDDDSLPAVRTTPTPTPTTSKIPSPVPGPSPIYSPLHNSPATSNQQPDLNHKITNRVSILTARASPLLPSLPSPVLLSQLSPPPPHHPASASASPPPPHRQPNCPQHCADRLRRLSLIISSPQPFPSRPHSSAPVQLSPPPLGRIILQRLMLPRRARR